MRNILYIVIFLEMCIANAQTTLNGVSVSTEIVHSTIQLKEHLLVKIPDSVTTLTLKALLFDKTKPTIQSISINGKKNNFEQKQEKGLVVLKITSEVTPIKNISITYNIDLIENKLFYMPIFFTNLSAASSDVGFFKMNMNFHPEQEYTIHFPRVALEETISQESKQIRFAIPALPSMIRMELLSEKKYKAHFIDTIDWMVAIVFIVIGYFIWRNRKKLRYG